MTDDKHLVPIPKGLVATVGKQLAVTEKLLAKQLNQPVLIPQIWNGIITSIAFSPDRQTLAFCGMAHTIRLFDFEKGVCLRILEGLTTDAKAIAFSHDGRRVAVIDWDNVFWLWTVDEGKLLKNIQWPTGKMENIVFMPDDQIVILLNEGDTASFWDVETAERLRVMEDWPIDCFTTAISPDGRIVSTSKGGIWEAESGACLGMTPDYDDSALALAVSNDGLMIAIGWADGTIHLVDGGSGECLWRLTVPSEPMINSIAFSFDGRMIAAGEDSRLSFWDVETGRCLDVQGYSAEIFSVSFASNYKLMAVGNWDGSIYIREAGSGVKTPPIIEWVLPQMHDAVFAPSAEILADSMHDGTIRLWETSSGKHLRDLVAQSGPVTSIIFSPDSRVVAAGGHDGTIRIWDVERGQCKQKIQAHSARVWTAAFSPDGQLLVSVGDDGDICFGAVASSDCLQRVYAPNEINCVCFSPDGKIIASGAECDSILLWSVEDGELLKKLDAGDCDFDSLAFSPDGRLIIAIGDDDIYIFDTEGFHDLRKLNLNNHTPYLGRPRAFSPDGQILALGNGDSKILFLDTSTWACRATIYFFPGNAWAVVAPDGRYDSSDSGESPWLRWTVAMKSNPVTQFKNRYYTPGLLEQVLNNSAAADA
jgi:WD40 repeat protein